MPLPLHSFLHDALPISFLLLLRSVETNPDAIHLRAGVPKGNVLLEVVRTLQHGPGNYPMNVHFAPGDEVNIHWVVTRPMLERSEEHTSELQSRVDLVCR